MSILCPKCKQELSVTDASGDSSGLSCPNCGTVVDIFNPETIVAGQSQPPLHPGDRPMPKIEGYEILNVLGEGGMGIVYEGLHTSLNRKVAIKVLAPHLSRDSQFVSRFEREIDVLVKARHPNIVIIFDRSKPGADTLYYIMEYVEGKDGGPPTDVQKLIASGSLDVPTIRRLILQVIDALGFAHKQGIIHRDVKPSNIMVDRHGNAVVMDFGIASTAGMQQTRHLTMEASAMGTFDYMAPEQRMDAALVNARADIYSTGKMLYEMLTGRLPPGEYPPPPSKLVGGLDSGWDAVVEKSLKSKEERFASMDEFAAAIGQIGKSGGPGQAADSGAHAQATATSGVVCPECNASISEADQYCLKCGCSLIIVCRGCGHETLAGAKFCPTCGGDVQRFRQFANLLRRAKTSVEQAKASTSPVEQLGCWEQACLALSKALRYVPDDAEAKNLLMETNRAGAGLAMQAAEVAFREKRLGDALQHYEQLLCFAPSVKGVPERIDQINRHREELLANARRRIEQGHIQASLEFLNRAEKLFPGDREICDLLEQYREKKTSTTTIIQQRIPTLESENRWFELSRVVKGLAESGMAIQGLDAFDKRIAQKLGEAEALISKSREKLNKGRFRQAKEMAEKASVIVSDYPDVQDILAKCQQKRSLKERLAAPSYIISALLCLAAAGVAAAACTSTWLAIPLSPVAKARESLMAKPPIKGDEIALDAEEKPWSSPSGTTQTPPGFKTADKAKRPGGSADKAFMAQDSPVENIPETNPYWPLPAAVAGLSLFSLLVLPRTMRGTYLLISAVLAACAWFYVVHTLKQELSWWTPVARYVRNPAFFPSPADVAGLDSAAWTTVGAIALLLIAAGVNLWRNMIGTIGVAAACGALGCIVFFTQKNPPANNVNLLVDYYVTEPKSPERPAAKAVVSLTNRGDRLLVVIPENSPQSEDGPSGKWIERWGKPDLMFRLKHAEADSSPDANLPKIVPVFQDDNPIGCLIGPGQKTEVSTTIFPVWKRSDTLEIPHNAAGNWILALVERDRGPIEFHLNNQQSATKSVSIPITGVTNPEVLKYEKFVEQCHKIRKELDEKKVEIAEWRPSDEYSESVSSACEKQIGGLRAVLDKIPKESGSLSGVKNGEIENLRESVERLKGPMTWALGIMERFQGLQAKIESRNSESEEDLPGPAAARQILSELQKQYELAFTDLKRLADNSGQEAAFSQGLYALESQWVAAQITQSALCAGRQNPQILALAKAWDKVGLTNKMLAGKISDSLNNWILHTLEKNVRLIGPSGEKSDNGGCELLKDALKTATRGNPTLSGKDEYVYANLLIGLESGETKAEDLANFSKNHPKYRSSEINCYLGFSALERKNYQEAKAYFSELLKQSDARAYAPLSNLAIAMADRALAPDEIIARCRAEYDMILAYEAKNKWSPMVEKAIGSAISGDESDAHASEMPSLPFTTQKPSFLFTSSHLPSSKDYAWLNKIIIIDTAEKWSSWKSSGKKLPIPWLKLGSDSAFVTKIKPEILKYIHDKEDTYIFFGDPLVFQNVTDLHLKTPQPLSGKAEPPSEFHNPLMMMMEPVEFDVKTTKLLLPVKDIPKELINPPDNNKNKQASKKWLCPFLVVKNEWFVCASYRFPNGGGISMLPDNIRDTKSGRAFIVNFINKASEYIK